MEKFQTLYCTSLNSNLCIYKNIDLLINIRGLSEDNHLLKQGLRNNFLNKKTTTEVLLTHNKCHSGAIAFLFS